MTLVITPETKVGELLDAYPGIEQQMIEWVPAFRKLQNPVLRKTVTKLVSLEQAARVGGIDVAELVSRLRKATGQPDPPPELFEARAQLRPAGRPSWVDEAMVRQEIHADKMIEAGEHPMGKVRAAVTSLGPREIVRVVSSFRPAPLIDAFRRGGASVFTEEYESGKHATYICAKPE